MNGYFGNLLQRTGIAIGRQSKSLDPLSTEPPVRPEASKTSQAFEIEAHREVVHPSVSQQSTDQPSETGHHQTLLAPSEPESNNPFVPEASHFIPRETAPAPAFAPNKRQQDELTAAEKPGMPETTRTESAVSAGKMFGSSEPREMNASTRPADKNTKAERNAAESLSSPRVQTQANRSTPPTAERTTNKMTRLVVREEAWKTAYNQVREWVAKQPVQTTEQQRDQIAGKAVDVMWKEAQTKLQARAVAGSNDREARSLTPVAREEIQNLHLSIGNIEISLEQPNRQDRRSAQAADGVAPKQAPERPSSRLRRHYLVP